MSLNLLETNILAGLFSNQQVFLLVMKIIWTENNFLYGPMSYNYTSKSQFIHLLIIQCITSGTWAIVWNGRNLGQNYKWFNSNIPYSQPERNKYILNIGEKKNYKYLDWLVVSMVLIW